MEMTNKFIPYNEVGIEHQFGLSRNIQEIYTQESENGSFKPQMRNERESPI